MYFNELNLRVGASCIAITKMGVNLPEMLINCLLGQSYDTQKTVKGEATFVNEKEAYEDMLNGGMSPWTYRKHLEGNDIFFIKDTDDPEPYRQFLRQGYIKLKPMIKFLLRKLGVIV